MGAKKLKEYAEYHKRLAEGRKEEAEKSGDSWRFYQWGYEEGLACAYADVLKWFFEGEE